MKNTSIQTTFIKNYGKDSCLRVEIFPNSEIYIDLRYANIPAVLIDIEFLEEIIKYAKMNRDANKDQE